MFSKRPFKVNGFTEEGFEDVRKAFEENFELGNELSAQLCVVQRGKVVYEIVN